LCKQKLSFINLTNLWSVTKFKYYNNWTYSYKCIHLNGHMIQIKKKKKWTYNFEKIFYNWKKVKQSWYYHGENNFEYLYIYKRESVNV